MAKLASKTETVPWTAGFIISSSSLGTPGGIGEAICKTWVQDSTALFHLVWSSNKSISNNSKLLLFAGLNSVKNLYFAESLFPLIVPLTL